MTIYTMSVDDASGRCMAFGQDGLALNVAFAFNEDEALGKLLRGLRDKPDPVAIDAVIHIDTAYPKP